MKFSFIIPTLDEEDYIGRLIESIKGQSEDAYEIIVVDNGSEDETVNIANDLGVRVVKEVRPGISAARNAGAKAAKGDYLCFIDADGVLSKDWLKEARRMLKRTKKKAVVGLNIFEHKNLVKKAWYNTYTFFAYLGLFLNRIFLGKIFLSNNMAIEKDIFEKTGGFEPVTGEDIWLSREFWKVGGKGEFNPRMVVNYSSRGFESYGYIKTIIYWAISTARKTPSHNYDYKTKTYKD